MNFGKIDRIIFLGGGRLLADLISLLDEKAMSVFVVTSDRQSAPEVFDVNSSIYV